MLAGCPVGQVENVLYSDDSTTPEDRCRVVRTMLNIAASVRELMTIIETSSPPLPDKWDKLLTWIFTRVGQVARLPSDNMDACSSLAGSGPGFMALVLEGLADGGVAMGVPRAEAQLMAAQVMRGMSANLLNPMEESSELAGSEVELLSGTLLEQLISRTSDIGDICDGDQEDDSPEPASLPKPSDALNAVRLLISYMEGQDVPRASLLRSLERLERDLDSEIIASRAQSIVGLDNQ